MFNYRKALGLAACCVGLAVPGTAGPLSERLLVTAQTGALSKIYVVRPDGRDWQRLTDQEGSEDEASFSAVRNEVYYRKTIGRENCQIWAWNLNTRQARALTPPGGLDRQPQVSPDGRWLAFSTQRFGVDALVLLDLDHPEETPRRLTRQDGAATAPAWSPDGSWLAYCDRRNGQADLYRLRLSDGEVQRLTRTEDDELTPSWSPDGKRMLFQTVTGWYRRGVLGWLDLDSGERHELPDIPGSLHAARWSPDGAEVVCLDYGSAQSPSAPALVHFSLDQPQPRPLVIYRAQNRTTRWIFKQVSWVTATSDPWPRQNLR